MRSCFFIGNRETSCEVMPALREAIEQHIVDYGVTEFFVGHYGGFDRLAAKAVPEAKKRHPTITLTKLIPLPSGGAACGPVSGLRRQFFPARYGKSPPQIRHPPGQLSLPVYPAGTFHTLDKESHCVYNDICARALYFTKSLPFSAEKYTTGGIPHAF